MSLENLAQLAADWGLPLSTRQLAWFDTYAQELAAWNDKVNLTTVTDRQEIVVRHFLDSLACARAWGNPESIIDVGSGAGFPGLPLKLLRPSLHLTLLESVGKKAAFLEHMVSLLGLSNVTVVVARAEEVGRNPAYREQYDLATARAVAALPTLAEYCLPLCRVGGRFLAPKGAYVDEELAMAARAIEVLGGQLLAVEPIQIADQPERTLIVVEKVAPTPATYPRRVGVPAQRPIL